MSVLPDGALMQRAAAGLAAAAMRRLARVYGSRVVVLVGGGDNGGDALFAAARLADRGAAVTALTVSSRLHEAGAAAARRSGVVIRESGDPGDEAVLAGAELVLDGMVGIGGSGGLRPAAARLAGWAPADRTIAVDVPSGVDADTGAVPGRRFGPASPSRSARSSRACSCSPGPTTPGPSSWCRSGSRCRRPIWSSSAPPTSAGCFPTRARNRRSTPAASSGITAGSDAYPGAAVLLHGGRPPWRRRIPALRGRGASRRAGTPAFPGRRRDADRAG